MKKKMVSTLLTLSMALGLIACGKENSINNGNSNDTSVVVENEVDATEAAVEEQGDSLNIQAADWLDFPYKDKYFGFSMMLPSDACRDAGYGYQCWINGDNKGEIVYITKYSGEVGDDFQKENIDMSTYSSTENIFDLLAANFEHESVIGGDYKLVDYNVETLETTTINGLEMTKFQGELDVVNDYIGETYYTFPIVAYGINTEKTPVLVCCIDRSSTDSDGESTHEEWITKIDDIVATFEE